MAKPSCFTCGVELSVSNRMFCLSCLHAEVPELIDCPFCDESDFDKIGLKSHLLNGHCEAFDKTERV